MNNITKFKLSSTFESTSEGGTLAYPNTSLVKETNQLHILLSEPKLYEWVDLGLPSGLKWASWNVGATKPEEFGLYFAWGETQGYTVDDINNGVKQFSWDDYKFSIDGSSSNFSKYNSTDNLTTLENVNDAAYQSNKTCRMPTKTDFAELRTNTIRQSATLNGVRGTRLISKTNSNSIFIPAAGKCALGSVSTIGSYGHLWGSSLSEHSDYGDVLQLYLDSASMSNYTRFQGLTIRPVQDLK